MANYLGEAEVLMRLFDTSTCGKVIDLLVCKVVRSILCVFMATKVAFCAF